MSNSVTRASSLNRAGRCPANLIVLGLIMLVSTGGCVSQIASNGLADALSGTGDTFASDDDPQLIREAAPFSLKLMESVLAETPRHRGLLTTTSRSFTEYA